MSMSVSSSKMDNLQEMQTAYLIAIAELEATKQDVTKLKQQHIESTLTIASLKEEIARLMEQLLLLKEQKFGKSSEKDPGEPILSSGGNGFIGGLSEIEQVSGYTRKKAGKSCGRSINLDTLPSYTIYHDLDEKDKICSCCNKPLVKIGQDISRQVEALPMRLYYATAFFFIIVTRWILCSINCFINRPEQ